MIHFGILHATHREQHTLLQCVQALHSAGATSIRVFPDDGTLGAIRNWNRALKALQADAGIQERVCVLDEDFIMCPEAMKRVSSLGDKWFDDGNAAALITMEQNIPHERRDEVGWVEVPFGYHTWGGAIVMGEHTALKLLQHDYYRAYLTNQGDGGKLIDAVPFETLRLMGRRLMQHLPSLADHIGTAGSTLGNNHADGATRGFRFNEWNA